MKIVTLKGQAFPQPRSHKMLAYQHDAGSSNTLQCGMQHSCTNGCKKNVARIVKEGIRLLKIWDEGWQSFCVRMFKGTLTNPKNRHIG